MSEPLKKRPLAIKLFQFQGHQDSIYHLVSAEDGKSFFSAGGDGMIVRWSLDEPDQGKLVAKVEGSVYAMCFDPKSGTLLIGQNNEGIHAVDVERKERIRSIGLGPTALFSILKVEDHIYVGSGEGDLIKLAYSNFSILGRIKFSSKSLRTIAREPKSGNLALGFSDQRIRYVDPGTMEVIHEWEAHRHSVFTLAFSPDGEHLVSGSRDARICRWRTGGNFEPTGTVAAHLFAINHISFSPDGEHFLTCSMDKTIKIWSTADLSLLRVLDKARHAGHGNSVNRLLWLNDDTFVSVGDDRIVSVWKFDRNPTH